MRTIVLVPEATAGDSTFTRTGGSTKHGVLTDASDSTYLTGSIGQLEDFSLSTEGLSGIVTAIRAGFRHKRTGSAVDLGASLRTSDFSSIIAAGSVTAPTATASESFTLTRSASTPDVLGFLRQSRVDDMVLRFSVDSAGSDWVVYEAWVELDITDTVGAIPVGF